MRAARCGRRMRSSSGWLAPKASAGDRCGSRLLPRGHCASAHRRSTQCSRRIRRTPSRCRSSERCSPSRTTSTSPAWRPPRPVRHSRTNRRNRRSSWTCWKRRARSSWARPISTSSRQVSSEPALPTGWCRTCSILRSSPAGRVPARQSRSHAGSSISRWAPIRQVRAGYPPGSTTSSAGSRRAASCPRAACFRHAGRSIACRSSR